MKTKSLSFQLEETVPGAFILQGLLGGALSGFMWMLVITLRTEKPEVDHTLILTPYVMFAGAVLGAIKALITRGVQALTGTQMRAGVRVALLINTVGLIVILLSQRAEFRNKEFAGWALIALVSSLPTALLIGSNVKPWELFTFGSIAVEKYRLGSRSVWRTLATLPLRFLSMLALAAWILIVACWRVDVPFINVAVTLGIPAIYFFYTAYITFRSPREIIVLTSGIVMSLPFACTAFWANWTYFTSPRDMKLLIVGGMATACVIVWALFVIARMSLRTTYVLPVPVLNELLSRGTNHPAHHCLGSRFLEWQQRIA
jgi:hypothetical protein